MESVFILPTLDWKLNQRNKWIDAIKRNNVDGSPWYPKPDDTICSEHFMGKKNQTRKKIRVMLLRIFPEIYQRGRFIYNDHRDAEIQADIATTSRILMTNNSRNKDKSCDTDKKSYEDQSTETKSQEFVGISSIKNDQELLDLAEPPYKQQCPSVSVQITSIQEFKENITRKKKSTRTRQQTGLEPAPFAIRADALTNYATAALTDRVEILSSYS
ncbi:hypothetical protein evm_004724 [Chilo suppressalis]|nr:hypothetical protein evm_004724 [Chilo suppressalis]